METLPAGTDSDRHIRALLTLAFGLAHDIAELCLNLEASPELQAHRFYGAQIADSAVSALAHVACANASYTPQLHDRIDASHSVGGAKDTLRTLDRLISLLLGHRYSGPEHTRAITDKQVQAMAILTALEVELLGANLPARRAS